MLFNSTIFIFIFLPIVLFGWYNIKSLKGRLIFLTTSSCIFYGYWDYRFVLLMFLSICLDYYCGNRIFYWGKINPSHAKKWVTLSIVINLLILCYFKYFNFFIDTLFEILPESLGFSKPSLEIILPIGISFYLFESMTYSIDIYKGIAKPATSFFHLSAYISMFPRLNAGPIVRYGQIEEQLANISDKINFDNLAKGLFIFSLGLFRKIYIADFFAEWSDLFFDSKVEKQFFVSWAGTLSYTFQIFFDFSAYCEMAYGLGIMLGFEFPKNFNSPYKAWNFSDFWKRWHIALSEFLRDYLYIPLGGNKTSKFNTYKNLMITMLLGGLWHGASWMFVVWGALHGLYLIMERLIKPFININHNYFYKFIVFIGVSLAWIFFRSPDINFALHTLKSCFMINGIEDSIPTYKILNAINVPEYFREMGGIKNIAALIVTLILIHFIPNVYQIKFKKSKLQLLLTVLLFYLCIIKIERPSPFIYFQF